jgi:hypothetical protein
VAVLPVSTVPGVDKYSDSTRIDSVNVVFPESALHSSQVAKRRDENMYQCEQPVQYFVFWKHRGQLKMKTFDERTVSSMDGWETRVLSTKTT